MTHPDAPADPWPLARVNHRRAWDDGLFSFTLDTARDFQAGQFVKLGLDVDGAPVHRAYSIASAPGQPLEFFVVRVDGGALSPRLHDLTPGDPVSVAPRIAGGFTLAKIPEDGARTLWMVATGTGLAPFLSMLREGSTLWRRFDRAVLLQGVRARGQVAYADELAAHVRDSGGRLRWRAVLSRDPDAPALPGAGAPLHGRLTTLLDPGTLEASADAPLRPGEAHVMLCGNPDMVTDLRHQLAARGLTLHTPTRHGAVHLEKYW